MHHLSSSYLLQANRYVIQLKNLRAIMASVSPQALSVMGLMIAEITATKLLTADLDVVSISIAAQLNNCDKAHSVKSGWVLVWALATRLSLNQQRNCLSATGSLALPSSKTDKMLAFKSAPAFWIFVSLLWSNSLPVVLLFNFSACLANL